MASGSTSRLHLPYPVASDPTNIPSDVEALANALDGETVVYLTSDTLSNRPAAGTIGRLYWATDTIQLFYDNGSAWVWTSDNFSYGLNSGRPSSPASGAMYYSTDTGVLAYWNGAAWTQTNLLRNTNASNITTLTVGESASAGAVGTAADAGHAHGMPAFSGSTPAAVGQSGTVGTSTSLPRSDHAHQGVSTLTAGTNVTLSGGDGSGHGALTVNSTGRSQVWGWVLYSFTATSQPMSRGYTGGGGSGGIYTVLPRNAMVTGLMGTTPEISLPSGTTLVFELVHNGTATSYTATVSGPISPGAYLSTYSTFSLSCNAGDTLGINCYYTGSSGPGGTLNANAGVELYY